MRSAEDRIFLFLSGSSHLGLGCAVQDERCVCHSLIEGQIPPAEILPRGSAFLSPYPSPELCGCCESLVEGNTACVNLLPSCSNGN